jgi:hypothetical protein
VAAFVERNPDVEIMRAAADEFAIGRRYLGVIPVRKVKNRVTDARDSARFEKLLRRRRHHTPGGR